MRFDLHIHSTFSRDGTAGPDEIIRRCRDVGLDGCSITDHNSTEGSQEAFDKAEAIGLVVVRGVEISSTGGHVIGYGLSSPIQRGLSVKETVDRIHKAGGIAVAPHPMRFGSGIGKYAVTMADFDAVEVLNGGSSARGNRIASRTAEGTRLPGVGGSDAHKTGEIGRAFTVVDDVSSEADVLRAVVEGRTKAQGRSRSGGEGLVYLAETVFDWGRRGFRRL